MSYNNFKATVWSKRIELELPKLMIFGDVVNTNHQGEAGKGKTVKIVDIANPTVKKYAPGEAIDTAEIPQDGSVDLTIDQYDYVNFMVDDIDAAQSQTDIMSALMDGAANALAAQCDKYIAGLVVNADSDNIIPSTAVKTARQAKELIDTAFEKLWEKGVNTANGNIYICVAPWFYKLFKNSLTELLTDNVDMVKKGILGVYNGAYVKLSNQIYNDGTDDCMAVMSKNAIAFAHGIDETDAYRPHNTFSDAIKMLHTYGAKVVRGEQIVCLKVHKG